MILVEHLTKYYGDVAAVKDLSFEVQEGHVYGFLGPNGAGKSTTMNIITGCLSATEGRVEVGGYDIFERPLEAKRLIGYLPEQPPLYLHETPLEYLSFVGEAKGLRGPALRDQVDRAVERTRLGDVLRRPIAALSKGYKQRLGIAQALLADPKVVILDEPTVGLDPLQIVEIRDLIRALGRDHTVLFSSHILSEVQAICDQLLILSHGALAAAGPTGELEGRLRSAGTVAFAAEAGAQAVLDALAAAGLPPVPLELRPDGTTAGQVEGSGEGRDLARRLFQAFAAAGVPLVELRPHTASLEDLFRALTEAPPPEGTHTPEKEDTTC